METTRHGTSTSTTGRVVFVLGMPRSGLRMVSAILADSGAWTGRTLHGSKHGTDFFENIRITRDVLTPAVATKDSGTPWSPQDARRRILGVAFNEGRQPGAPLLYKHANLVRVPELLAGAFPAALWVVVRRDLRDVAQSCVTTAYMTAHGTDYAAWYAWAVEQKETIDHACRVAAGRDMACVTVYPSDFVHGMYDGIKKAIEGAGMHYNPKIIETYRRKD